MEDNKNVTRRPTAPVKRAATKKSASNTWPILKVAMHYLWKFRGIVISLPVFVFAIGQAFRNASVLPEKVGMDIQATGEFAVMVSRPIAVLVPLLITIGCILLTCFTKRPLFPWLISIFSLILPVLIMFINVYPA